MLAYVALAFVHPLYRGDSQVAAYLIRALRYYSVCVGCNKSSTRLLSMLAYLALALTLTHRTELDSGKICTRNAQVRLAAEYVVQAKLPDQRHFR